MTHRTGTIWPSIPRYLCRKYAKYARKLIAKRAHAHVLVTRVLPIFVALGILAFSGQPAGLLKAETAHAQTRTNWNTHVEETAAGGFRLGHPKAKARLITFVSYTCPACKRFEQEAMGPMRIAYVASGRLSIEVRHVIRNAIDLTAATAAQCGPAKTFFLNHAAIFSKQDQWLEKAQNAPASAQSRWRSGTERERMIVIAHDLGFYDIMASRGVDRLALNKCFANSAKIYAIAASSMASAEEFAISSTPSFALNEQLQKGVHNWADLQPAIEEQLQSASAP